jgi:hypothetical protein
MFFERLVEVGGTPEGWKIYPHSADDGKALHIVQAESQNEILSQTILAISTSAGRSLRFKIQIDEEIPKVIQEVGIYSPLQSQQIGVL